jgi:PAS domain-containing protein
VRGGSYAPTSKLNSNTAVIPYEPHVERETNETELVILVREPCGQTETDGELNLLLRDFASDLVKRRLIRKVEFLRARNFGPAGMVDASSTQSHSVAMNRKLLASCRDAIVRVNAKIMTFTTLLLFALKPVKVLLLRALETLAKLARSISDKPRRLREERREREKNLRELLTTSFDPIVVTNGERRFVTANSRALDLFGISERNLTMFTIDAFLPHRQVLEFDERRASLVNSDEMEGKCDIKPLNGSLLVAQYTFISNIVPGRSLYRFRSVAPRKMNRFGCEARTPTSYSPRHWAITRFPARVSES